MYWYLKRVVLSFKCCSNILGERGQGRYNRSSFGSCISYRKVGWESLLLRQRQLNFLVMCVFSRICILLSREESSSVVRSVLFERMRWYQRMSYHFFSLGFSAMRIIILLADHSAPPVLSKTRGAKLLFPTSRIRCFYCSFFKDSWYLYVSLIYFGHDFAYGLNFFTSKNMLHTRWT